MAVSNFMHEAGIMEVPSWWPYTMACSVRSYTQMPSRDVSMRRGVSTSFWMRWAMAGLVNSES